MIKDITTIQSTEELLREANWLVGKTLIEIVKEVNQSDEHSRVKTKAKVGYVIEDGFFGIKKNSASEADIAHLGIEIKTCPLKYNKDRTKLSVKEPLSLNIINYTKEVNNTELKQSSLYAKNKKILFIVFIHDDLIPQSQYVIKYVFLWEITDLVIKELTPDYQKIISMIRAGKAHAIHQHQHQWLTLCPKHGGKFKDPYDRKSKTLQPYSDLPAEIRAYRLKVSYMNKIICRRYQLELQKGGWLVS